MLILCRAIIFTWVLQCIDTHHTHLSGQTWYRKLSFICCNFVIPIYTRCFYIYNRPVVLIPDFMRKMHVIGIFTGFYIPKY